MASYSVELKLNTKKQSDRNYLENYFAEVAKIGNTVRSHAISRLNMLRRNPEYKELLSIYVNLKKGKEKSEVSDRLYEIVSSYGLTKYGLQKCALDLRKNLKYVHADVYQKICDSVWNFDNFETDFYNWIDSIKDNEKGVHNEKS